ncbi:hypothetical protein SAMN05216201_11131 [Pseudomonas linyingensis]|uniref:Uncharacterized protein n=1 Tax=Pseudomonas linyingensis TaxID=915471 RepID=A0A1H6ZZJ7_9PSED|nr:hypothetical protein [Pseudomonas linyingensis]SEJ57077.1 hypothetical protein SAMN05216201_11131 [Pseudomonas linyingensis]
MTRITVVIEDRAEGVHLGQQLAGGRVVAAMQGDHSELREALETAEYVLLRWGCGSTAAMARAAITKASA